MKVESVSWERIVSATVAAPAVPLLLHTHYIDDDGTIQKYSEPVIGILVEIVETYERPKRTQYDSGAPGFPPTPRSLPKEGYRFIDRFVRKQFLICDSDFAQPVVAEEASNASQIATPANEDAPEWWVEQTEKHLRDWHSENHRPKNVTVAAPVDGKA